MGKESYYFSHDYDAQNDPKIQALISEYKAEGYGIYWSIIEMLHKEEKHHLPFKKYVFIAIAKQMLANVEQVEALINSCINDYELLVKDGEFFTSKRVLNNFNKREEISLKRSEAAKIGNEKRWNIANASQSIANGRKGKEKKRKESTIKEFDIFLEKFNEKKNSNYRPNDKIISAFEQRIKNYSLDEMLKAVDNCLNDKYHQENPKYLTPEFILRPTKLEMYINAPKTSKHNNGANRWI